MLWPQACNRQTAYCVPLYDTLGPDAVEYIIGHAEVTIVFASALKMRALVEPLSRAKGKVKAVIVWGEVDGIAKMVSTPVRAENGRRRLGSSMTQGAWWHVPVHTIVTDIRP